MFRFLFAYFAHRIKSFHLHGIHSPFVFVFEKKCLRDSRDYQDYLKLSRFRESVHNSNTRLHVEDHGAGSKIFTSDVRKVKDILRHNCSTGKDTQLLYRICRYFEVDRILELGTSLGIAAHAMAIARPQAQITTVEGSTEVHAFAENALENEGITNVQCHHSTFQDYLELLSSEQTPFDLIYMDGHHDGAATLDYFETLLQVSHPDTIIILDDIYWSSGMTAAWNAICEHPSVTASVDCFDMGFIFLRTEQGQERFHIKL